MNNTKIHFNEHIMKQIYLQTYKLK